MPEQKNIHFNGLNGIRAICALAVVASHVGLGLRNIGINTGYSFGLATYGVTAFFALSGFLITYLLSREKSVYGTVDVRKFYMRRILRIWPLYFGYLIVAILADHFIFQITDFSSLGFYVFFFPNIPFAYGNAGLETFTPILFLGHFWSLGIEEQFYAFYPWLIKLFKKIVVVLVSMLCIMLLLKIVAKYWWYKTGNPFWYAWVAATPFEAMAIGGLGACLYKEKPLQVAAIVKSKILQIITAVILLLVMVDKLKIINPFSHVLIAVVTVIVIYYAHLLQKPVFNLHNKYLDQLGKMSYGIYVYHPLVMGIMGLLIRGLTLSPVYKIALLLIATISVTIVIAYLSYNYFEKYFLDLKYRYGVVKNKD